MNPQENKPAESHRADKRRRYNPSRAIPKKAALANPEEARLRYAIRAIDAMSAEQYADTFHPRLQHFWDICKRTCRRISRKVWTRNTRARQRCLWSRRLGGMEDDEHARAFLGALVNRADELEAADRRQPLSDVRLRERLELNAEAETGYHERTGGINRLTRYQARILLDDLDRTSQSLDWLRMGTEAEKLNCSPQYSRRSTFGSPVGCWTWPGGR